MVAVGLLLMSGGFVLVSLPLWWSRTPRPQRQVRRATVWIERGVIYVSRGRRRHAVALEEVASARHNIDDAVTLFNARGRLLMRVPRLAYGVGDLRDVLVRCGVDTD